MFIILNNSHFFLFQGISAWQHPVIVLKDVPLEDLQGIVEFIYHGEVSVDKGYLEKCALKHYVKLLH